MATNESNVLPVHLVFTKKINQRTHSLRPKKLVKGNVILFVPERTIDKFNIPVFKGEVPMSITRKETTRTLQDKKSVNVSSYQFIKQGLNKNIRQVKILYGYNPKSYDNSTDHYLINFPYFFNISMIRDSLFLMFNKNKEGTRFMVLPSQKKRDIFIGNKDMVNVSLGSGKLVQGMNIDDAKFGECTIVDNPVRRKQSIKKVK